jgi:Fe-S-cluster containining protein
MYLPQEAEEISKKLNINPKELGKKSNKGYYYIGKDDPDCIYFQKGRCEIHKLRPLDCRSFPIVPFYNNGKTKFILTSFCPAVNTITRKDIEQVIALWKEANPSKEWLKEYSKKFDYLLKYPYRVINQK